MPALSRHDAAPLGQGPQNHATVALLRLPPQFLHNHRDRTGGVACTAQIRRGRDRHAVGPTVVLSAPRVDLGHEQDDSLGLAAAHQRGVCRCSARRRRADRRGHHRCRPGRGARITQGIPGMDRPSPRTGTSSEAGPASLAGLPPSSTTAAEPNVAVPGTSHAARRPVRPLPSACPSTVDNHAEHPRNRRGRSPSPTAQQAARPAARPWGRRCLTDDDRPFEPSVRRAVGHGHPFDKAWRRSPS